MPQTERHFAWFRHESGQWLGEWAGLVPAPIVPPSVIGDWRLQLLNEWTQQVQRYITPNGSPYAMQEQAWDLDAWDDCPAGGAVCLDVTMYRWPFGDFFWALFDGVDRLIDFRHMRAYLQLTPATATFDASVHSARPVRSSPQKLVADVTGTLLEPWVDKIHGRLVRRDGRIVFEPFTDGMLPEAVVLSITDRNASLSLLHGLDPARIPEGVLA